MAVCRECKFWKPIEGSNSNIGDCFGHRVPGDLDVEHCPANAFQPRD